MLNIHCPRLLADIVPGVGTCPIFMVRRQYLVAVLEVNGLGDQIDPEGGIGHENKIFRVCIQILSYSFTSPLEVVLQVSTQKLDRLALKLSLPILIGLEYGVRCRAEGAMIQKDHIWVKQKKVSELAHGIRSHRFW